MRTIRNLLLLSLVIFAVYSIMNESDKERTQTFEKAEKVLTGSKTEKKRHTEAAQLPVEGDLYKWIGAKQTDLIKQYGEPVRVDSSAYGYEWLIYKEGLKKYIQFGVENGKVKTLFAIGDGISTEPVQAGDTYETVNSKLKFSNEVSYEKGVSAYTFKLKEKDMKMWPLKKLNDDLFAQYYFDTFTKKLSAVRLMDAEVLLKQRPYEVEYRGSLPERPELSASDWKRAEAGMEKQILDITNIMRNEHGKQALKPDPKTAEVAYLHSKDMSENHYFSHYGLDGTGLKERLAEKKLTYIAAGENIAAISRRCSSNGRLA